MLTWHVLHLFYLHDVTQHRIVTVVHLDQVVAHVLFTARQNVLHQKRHQPNVLHVSIRQLAETETHYKNDNSFLISARGKVLRSFMTRANINAPT